MVETAHAYWKIAKIGEHCVGRLKSIGNRYLHESISSDIFATGSRINALTAHALETRGIGQTPTSLERYLVGGRTSLPKVIWEQGRVAAVVPGAGWHKWLRIRNVCIVFVKDTCVRKRAVF